MGSYIGASSQQKSGFLGGVLGLANTKQTVRVNVDEDDKRKLEELQGRNVSLRLDSNEKNTIFLNESGLCSLIMRSEKPEATP